MHYDAERKRHIVILYHIILWVNADTLRSGQHDRRFANDSFTRISWRENLANFIQLPLQLVAKGPTDN